MDVGGEGTEPLGRVDQDSFSYVRPGGPASGEVSEDGSCGFEALSGDVLCSGSARSRAVRVGERVLGPGAESALDGLSVMSGDGCEHLLFQFVGFRVPVGIAGVTPAYRVVEVVQQAGVQEDAWVCGEHECQGRAPRVVRPDPHCTQHLGAGWSRSAAASALSMSSTS